MQETRFAFAAEYWGEGAVVCLAREDCPGPIVDQQFGVFDSWTHASAFANKLNEGLEISPADALQIVTSARLARTDLLTEWAADWAPDAGFVEVDAWRFGSKLLLAQLDIAMRLCEASKLADKRKSRGRMEMVAYDVLDRVEKMVYRFRLDREYAEIVSQCRAQIREELRERDKVGA